MVLPTAINSMQIQGIQDWETLQMQIHLGTYQNVMLVTQEDIDGCKTMTFCMWKK